MQLTLYTDYSLRLLLYLALKGDVWTTLTEVAENYGISRNHLVEVAHRLTKDGYIQAVRGKGGGMRLARPAEEITIGEVVRQTEGNFDIVECFNAETNTCSVAPVCKLKFAIYEAYNKFVEVLDSKTLAEMGSNREELLGLLGVIPIKSVNGD